MNRSILLLLIIVFKINWGFAQSNINTVVQNYTTQNGMPSNGIKGLQWDANNNFLWLATEAGIVRFNGTNIKIFNNENVASMGSERMLFMTSAHSKKIFITDIDGKVFSIEQNLPSLIRTPKKQKSPYSGFHYLLNVSEKNFKLNENDSIHDRFSAILDETVSISDTTGVILHNKNLYLIKNSNSSPTLLSTINKPIKNIFKINNKIFIHTQQEITYEFDVTNNQIKSIQPLKINGKLFWNPGMNQPIIVNKEKAWIIYFTNNQFTYELISNQIPQNVFLRCIEYSKENEILFIGTDSKGLYVLKRTALLSKKRKNINPLNRNSYYAQIELSNNAILTNEGDIIEGETPFKDELPIKGKFSFYVSATNDSLLWYRLLTNNTNTSYFSKLNTVTKKTTIYPKIESENVVTFYKNNYYLANHAGIGILDNDTIKYLHKYPSTINLPAYSIEPMANNTLAIATCNGALIFNVETHQLDTIFNIRNTCVRSIWKYNDYVFFGTYGAGFYIWKNGKIKAMPLDKNKYLQYTHCIVKDDENYCWISTNRGLFKASLKELLEVFEKNTSTVYYHYLGEKDGIEMTELNGGCKPCALTLNNKIISFPTMDGILWVDPKRVKPILPSGQIFIDEITVDSTQKNLQYLTSTQLSSSTKDIKIKLAFSAWGNSENVKLEYQLNDTLLWKPVTIGNGSEIELTNLMPGKYYLRIRKMNGFGFNNYSYKVIVFTIAIPWYNKWWFYCILIALLSILIYTFLKIRTVQLEKNAKNLQYKVIEKTKELQQQNEVLEKNNSIKTKLISIISHDIVTPLKFVTVAGKNLLEKRNIMTQNLQQETLQEITNTSQELHLLSTNILNWIKYQNENRRMAKENFLVHELVIQIFSILNSLAKQKNIELINKIDTTLIVHQFYEPLKILIYNLLTNAIHFTEKGQIIVYNLVDTRGDIICVQDQGCGMTKEQIQNILEDTFIITSANVDNKKGHGLGYLIIKDLIKTMGASISIDSEKNKGTKVAIQLGKQPNSKS
jgi:signal transduction histidine kinase